MLRRILNEELEAFQVSPIPGWAALQSPSSQVHHRIYFTRSVDAYDTIGSTISSRACPHDTPNFSSGGEGGSGSRQGFDLNTR